MNLRFILNWTIAILSFKALARPESVYGARHLTRSEQIEASYDYVIVGGGTAGLTVADRLTEDGKSSVLVVEYGNFEDLPSDPVHPPNGVPPRLMYNITSVGTKKIQVGIGCCVGGSSAINSQIFMRGTSEDYDRWQALGGPDSAWDWEGMLPYFKKSATFTPPNAQLARDFNITYDLKDWGARGPIFASWPDFLYPGTKIMRDAWAELPGVDCPQDGSDGRAGIISVPTSMDPKTYTRSYARTGHYDRVKSRPNYFILTGHKATKINFATHGKTITATGVSIVSRYDNKSLVTVLGRKEIVLSAGSIHSPQILQRSGIGARATLHAANISQVLELPGVGQNFHDHPWFYSPTYQFRTNVEPNPPQLRSNGTFATWARESWETNRTGPYTSTSGPNFIAQLSLPVIAAGAFDSIAADIEGQNAAKLLPDGTDPTVIAGYGAQLMLMAKAARSKNTAWIQFPLRGTESSYIFDIHPLSRGSVTIDPSDPNGEPLVDYRSLSNPVDLRVMVELFKTVRAYFKRAGSIQTLSPVEISPGANVTSDEEIAKYMTANFGPSAYHPVGTCAKMPKDIGGVVDEDLRVHGIRGLTVADASIMPLIVGATTQSTVYAIAEKAADLIKSRASMSW